MWSYFVWYGIRFRLVKTICLKWPCVGTDKQTYNRNQRSTMFPSLLINIVFNVLGLSNFINDLYTHTQLFPLPSFIVKSIPPWGSVRLFPSTVQGPSPSFDTPNRPWKIYGIRTCLHLCDWDSPSLRQSPRIGTRGLARLRTWQSTERGDE